MPKKIHVQAQINGREADFLCEPRQSLLEVLRDELRLTGTKEGCNNGNCGACNVLLDGRLVNSCVVLGVEVQGRSVTTIEGIAGPQGLHPLQQKFLEDAALRRASSMDAPWRMCQADSVGGPVTPGRGPCRVGDPRCARHRPAGRCGRTRW